MPAKEIDMKKYIPRRGEWPVREAEPNSEGEAYYLCRDVMKNLKKLKFCPQCGSDTGIKMPTGCDPYCEDCGYPDSDFDDA